MTGTEDQIMKLLRNVKDPEIPVLDVVEMGIVRHVHFEPDGAVRVDITPTYSGCPAMHVIREDIVRALHDGGFEDIEVHTVFDEAWSTEWMTEEARTKLSAYGIAPPGRLDENDGLLPLLREESALACPFCGSNHTRLTSAFGATACKSLHFCEDCRQPFEHFKCI